MSILIPLIVGLPLIQLAFIKISYYNSILYTNFWDEIICIVGRYRDEIGKLPYEIILQDHPSQRTMYVRRWIPMRSTLKAPRSRRLNLRTSSQQEALMRRAAQELGENLTDFIIRSACAEAEQTLADQRRFSLDADQWNRVCGGFRSSHSAKTTAGPVVCRAKRSGRTKFLTPNRMPTFAADFGARVS